METTIEIRRKDGIEQLKDVAHRLKTLLSGFPGENPAYAMWCDHVINSDGVIMEIPGVFSRIGRLQKKRQADMTKYRDFSEAKAVFREEHGFGTYVLRFILDDLYEAGTCKHCGRWFIKSAGRSCQICDPCIKKNVHECKICHHTCTFEEAFEGFARTATYRRINGKEEIICKECTKNTDKFRKCACCGETVFNSGMTYGPYENGTRKWYCKDCQESYRVKVCYDCGEAYPAEKMVENICIKCALKESKKKKTACIHDFDHKPKAVFISTTPAISTPLGVELEVDRCQKNEDDEFVYSHNDQSDEVLNFLGELNSVYLKDDGSLNTGFEIVTHPMSLEAHKTVVPYQAMFSLLTKEGYSSHDNDTCGLHVHIGRSAFGDTERKQKTAIGKIIFLIEKFQSQFTTFSRRKSMSYTHFYDLPATHTPAKMYNEVMKINCPEGLEYYEFHRKRYRVVNLQNKNTVEIRIFKGTLNPGTYFAVLEMCDYMTNYVVSHKKPSEFMDLSWEKFTGEITESKYPNLIRYMRKKKLMV